MLQPTLKRKIISFIAIVAAGSCIAALLLFSELFSELENRSWDWRLQSIADPSKADSSIKVIIIDQSSLEHMATEEKQFWPWPRELYVPIVEFLRQAGAKGLAVDILFSEQSHYGVADDEAFAKSFQSSMPVVLAAALRTSQSDGGKEEFDIFKRKYNGKGIEKLTPYFPKGSERIYSTVTLPIPLLLNTNATIGNVSVPNDSDGIFRHIISGGYVKGFPLLTLPFALFEATRSSQSSFDINHLFNSSGSIAVRFQGPARTYRTYPYDAVLRSFQAIQEGQTPLISLSEFKDSYVFLGMDAPGLLDLRPTPLSRAYPGVEYHATALDNLLHNSFIREARFGENLIFSVCGILMLSAVALFVNRARIQIPLIILTLSLFVAATYFIAEKGVWIQLVIPTICSLVAMIAALAIQYHLEGSQHRFIKKAFKYYVSPEVIDKIVDDPHALTLGGERRELSIFFCDIAGFTSISESMDPGTVGRFLNVFLSEMTEIILENSGTVDKYVGDAIVAFWNAPLSTPDHAFKAVSAAMQCQERLKTMREELKKEFGVDVFLRIGIHTGDVTVGNFGSKERFNYTVIGDTANLASRLEGANKFFGTDILISEDTFEYLKGRIGCRKLGSIRVVGRDEGVVVYEPSNEVSGALIKQWNNIVDLFQFGNVERAHQLLSEIPSSKLKTLYVGRTNKGIDWNLSEK